MSPDSLLPSTQRRAWRVMSATAAVLAAVSVLISVWLYTRVQDSRREAFVQVCRDTNIRHDATIAVVNRLLIIASAREFARQASDPARLHVLGQQAQAIRDVYAASDELERMAAETKRLLPPPARTLFDRQFRQLEAIVTGLAPKRPCDRVADQLAE